MIAWAEEYSGTTGDCTWHLDTETGVLTITGNGRMGDYHYDSPWHNFSSDIKEVVINPGVTYIGSFTFWDLNNLMSMTIPEGVTEIGDYAFWGCSGLTSVTIPSSVTYIGGRVFNDCTGLTSVSILASSIKIAEDAFGGCSNLTSIYLKGIASCIIDNIFPEGSTITYGDKGGYAYIYYDIDSDYLNTVESPIDKSFVNNNFELRIPICINKTSNVDICQIQFDFGVWYPFAPVTDSNGKPIVEMDRDRFDYDEDFGYSHTMTITEKWENEYRVLITSPDNTPIQGDDGAIVYIPIIFNGANLVTDCNLRQYEGDMAIFKSYNHEFSTTYAQKITFGEHIKWAKIYLRDSGDFNGDGTTSVTDYAGTVRWISGSLDTYGAPEWCVRKATDVNEDGNISVTDIAGIVNIILYGNYTGNVSNGKSRMPAYTSDASLSIEPFSINAGETKEITVDLSSTLSDLGHCQFDLTLPEGLSVASINGKPAIFSGDIARDHKVVSAQREDGTVRVLCLSANNESFCDNHETVARIKLVADKDLESGNQDIELTNVEFSKTDATKICGAGTHTTVAVKDEATGIVAVNNIPDYGIIYGVDGVRRNQLSRGVNIIRYEDGSLRKVFVK